MGSGRGSRNLVMAWRILLIVAVTWALGLGWGVQSERGRGRETGGGAAVFGEECGFGIVCKRK